MDVDIVSSPSGETGECRLLGGRPLIKTVAEAFCGLAGVRLFCRVKAGFEGNRGETRFASAVLSNVGAGRLLGVLA